MIRQPENRLLLLAAIVVALIASFQLGRSFERWRYDDRCLDMGGGRNPGNHPICVIDR